jgi:hypothetical protein
MRKTILSALLASLPCVMATATAQDVVTPAPDARRAATRANEPDTTYGKVKEITARKKLVIDVDDAIDKSFDLTDRDVTYNLPKDLKVGDTVKIVERDAAGKNKTVEVAKHSGGGVKHGDADRAQDAARPAPDASAATRANEPDTSYGKVKEITAGKKVVIDVDNAIDKDFDLTDRDVTYKVAKDLKVGDTVKIVERDAAGKKKTVEIAKHAGGGVKHGDADREKK